MLVVFKKHFLVFYFIGLLKYSSAIINGTISAIDVEVNGEWITPDYADNFPFMIEIVKGVTHQCGGAIIRKNAVITVASCISLDGTTPKLSEFSLLAGNQVIKEDHQIFVQKRDISKAVLHPGWPENDGANLAVLKPSKDFEMTPWVNLIYLDYTWPEETFEARFFGWGYTEQNRYSSLLRHAWTYVDHSSTCTHIRSPGILCLREHDGEIGGGIPCYGDFGGPVMLDNEDPLHHTLVGMIAFNLGAPTPGKPGQIACAEKRMTIGINVTYYRNYIDEVIANYFE